MARRRPSSELLSAICDALGAAQSDVLRAASDTLALAEEMERMLVFRTCDPGPVPPGSQRLAIRCVQVRKGS